MKDIKDYIRVTDVLFPFSGLKGIDPEILRKAADRGTRVHTICDAVIQGMGIPGIDEDIQGYLNSFFLWAAGKKFLTKPDRFFHDSFMLTGECDGLYMDQENKIVLIDFKTPLKESKTWPLQAAAYRMLASHDYDFPLEIDRAEFIQLKKNGTAPTVYTYPLEPHLADFLLAFEAYKKFFLNASEQSFLDYL
jgi:hypothetical protein